MSAPEIDLLIAAEKAARGPSPEVRARLGARLQGSLATPVAPTAPAAPAAPAAGAGLASKLLVAVGFGALLGAGLHATLSTPPEAPKVVAPAPAPALPPVVEAPRPVVDTLAQERRLLELAREDVARGAYADALATLAAHRALYSNGQLAEEREALGVQVLVRAGRYDEARSEGAKFVAHFPNGLMVPVVEAALSSIPVTGSGRSPQ